MIKKVTAYVARCDWCGVETLPCEDEGLLKYLLTTGNGKWYLMRNNNVYCSRLCRAKGNERTFLGLLDGLPETSAARQTLNESLEMVRAEIAEEEARALEGEA